MGWQWGTILRPDWGGADSIYWVMCSQHVVPIIHMHISSSTDNISLTHHLILHSNRVIKYCFKFCREYSGEVCYPQSSSHLCFPSSDYCGFSRPCSANWTPRAEAGHREGSEDTLIQCNQAKVVSVAVVICLKFAYNKIINKKKVIYSMTMRIGTLKLPTHQVRIPLLRLRLRRRRRRQPLRLLLTFLLLELLPQQLLQLLLPQHYVNYYHSGGGGWANRKGNQ